VLLKKPLSVKTTDARHKSIREGKQENHCNSRQIRQIQLKPLDISEKIVNGELKAPTSFIALDIETTGLRSKEDSIIELAAIRYEQGEMVEQYHSLIKSEKRIPEEVISLTGITNELLEEQGKEIKDVLEEFRLFAGDHVLVGHFVLFDLRFLREICSVLNVGMMQYRYIDTVVLSKIWCHEPVENYKLETLIKKYLIADKQSHRALPDAILAAKLYLKLIENPKG